MGKVFTINSKQIFKIEIDTTFGQFKVELQDKLIGQEILKILQEYKQMKIRDSKKSHFDCSISNKNNILLVTGWDLKEALMILNNNDCIDNEKYKQMCNFINKNMDTKYESEFDIFSGAKLSNDDQEISNENQGEKGSQKELIIKDESTKQNYFALYRKM
jgi:hypothetical protein